jgi:aspartate/methionine/tyrosine aminotransferase
MLTLHDKVASQDLMDFSRFLVWSDNARRVVPEAERHCETRIARALSHLAPIIQSPTTPPRIHRCDLVRLWREARRAQTPCGRILVSEGVRDSLRVIFKVLARSGATVAIPTDVYPVYWKLAIDAELGTVGFATFPSFDIDRILHSAAVAGAHHVLLPQPLKLQGRGWTDQETATVEDWLRADDRRRLLVDGVYGLGLQLDSISRRLIEIDRVVFLDSLSKRWLHEQVFGVAVVPERDANLYATPFRDRSPAQSKLFAANELLTRFLDVPRQIELELDTRRQGLMQRMLRTRLQVLTAQGGYLLAVQCSSEELLKQYAIVAIPASAFGSRLADWSVASALPATDTPL